MLFELLFRFSAALGNYNKALDCQKYFLCTSQGNAVNKLRAMSNIGDVLTRMKQFNDAMKMFEKQLSLARSLEDVMNEANAFMLLHLLEIVRNLPQITRKRSFIINKN